MATGKRAPRAARAAAPGSMADAAPVVAAPVGEAEALAALIRDAEGAQARAEATAAADEVAAAVPSSALVDDVADTLRIVRGLLAPLVWWLTVDEFQRVWSDDVVQGVAAPGAVIMERHGLTMAGVIGQWGPYLALAAALGPPAVHTLRGYRAARVAGASMAAARTAAGDGRG